MKCKLTVTNPTLSSKKAYQTIGGSEQLSIHGTKGKVKWYSENPAIASVNGNGTVTAVDYGTTKICAKVDGKVYKCSFTTEAVPKLSSLYYLSASNTCALADKVMSCDKSITSFQDLMASTHEKKQVGDITAYDFSGNNAYPIYECYTYTASGTSKGSAHYTDIYVMGTSQTGIVTTSGKNSFFSTGVSAQYIAKDGFGIVRVYLPNNDQACGAGVKDF